MKKFFLLCLIALLLPLTLYSADYYDAGSQQFSFRLGTNVPLFTNFYNMGVMRVGPGEGNTGMKMGGYGAISYQMFNSPKTAIGGEIGYNFNFSAEEEFFSAVPFFAKYSYFPLQGAVDIPLSVGLGAAYIKYKTGSLMTLYTNFEVGAIWFPGENWGFGISTGLWLIPELNYKDELTQYNALLGIIPITLSVTYRQ